MAPTFTAIGHATMAMGYFEYLHISIRMLFPSFSPFSYDRRHPGYNRQYYYPIADYFG
jgi:hypothetical protein